MCTNNTTPNKIKTKSKHEKMEMEQENKKLNDKKTKIKREHKKGGKKVQKSSQELFCSSPLHRVKLLFELSFCSDGK